MRVQLTGVPTLYRIASFPSTLYKLKLRQYEVTPVLARSWISPHNKKRLCASTPHTRNGGHDEGIVYVGMDVHKETVSIAILRDSNMHYDSQDNTKIVSYRPQYAL